MRETGDSGDGEVFAFFDAVGRGALKPGWLGTVGATRIGRWLHWYVQWLCLVLSMLAGGALAQATDHPLAGQTQLADQEPITPIPQPPAADPLKLMLGESLFGDPRLSRDGSLACSSCHDVHTNGADNGRRTMAEGGLQPSLNTLTVFNAALSFRLNWEGNFRTLEAQAESSFGSTTEMASSTDQVLQKLKADPKMVRRFDAIYGQGPDRSSLLDAIATFERSLLTPGSRFDRWLGGDAEILTAEEQTGYRLFKSLGCVSCHQGVNVGGNLYERHGIFRPLASPQPEILRVPSLRNVATTAPYFHDGSAPTLSDAVRKMAAAQLDQTLSNEQIGAIVAFLQTLTGTYRGLPVTAASP